MRKRPATPHRSGLNMDFDEPSSHMIDTTIGLNVTETSGCMGLSLASMMKTLRSPSSALSPHLSSHSQDTIFHHFHALRSKVQNTFTCATSDTYQPMSPKCAVWAKDDVRIESDDMSLSHRAFSWGTHDSASGESPLPADHNQVKFHFPLVTSVRIRSRTRTNDIDQLFFSPEELDEIKDDRYDTMMTDDIETLAVGEVYDWCDMASRTSSSSIFSASDCDDLDSKSGLMLAETVASNVVFDRAGSPRKRESLGDKKFVRGVQIMLREKSADRSF